MKKLLSLLLCAALAATCLGVIAGCTGDPKEEQAEIVVWQAEQDVAFTEKVLKAFMEENKNIKVTVRTQAETDAATALKNDPSAAADVLSVPHDQLGILTEGTGYIFAVPKTATEYKQIEADNTPNTISTITVNGNVMGFPVITETYFLYYNKTVYDEADVASFEKMFDKAASKQITAAVGFDYDNGFYAGMFNLAMPDCYLFRNNEASQVLLSTDKGVAANKWAQTNTATNKMTGAYTDDAAAATALLNGTLGAWITGPWAKDAMAQAVGGEDKLGMAKIPTFKVDGTDYNPISFSNIKLYVINKQTKSSAAAMKVAAYLSSEAVQKQRFMEKGYIPAAKNLAESNEVKANAVARVVAQQSVHALPQPITPNMGNGWYNNAAAQTMYKALFINEGGKYSTDAQIKAVLQTIETVCKNGGVS